MRQVRLSPKARSDLDSIWDYTAKNWDLEKAEEYLRALGATFNLIAASPFLGRSIDDVREGYFRFPAASHIVFYRVHPAAIDIIRVSTRAWTWSGICKAPTRGPRP